MTLQVILNPASGHGRAGRLWNRAESILRQTHPDLVVHRTTGRGDAATVASALVALGPGATLLAVGGDGTVHEVVNGMLHAGPGAGGPVLAILPAGSGNDLARQLGLPRDPAALAALLMDRPVRTMDVVRAEWPGGREWFVNVASFGFTGQAARLVDRMGKRFGGVSYVAGALLALARHRNVHVHLAIDAGPGTPVHLACGVAANASWFAAGMHVAPGSAVDDGLLDLIQVGARGRAGLLRLLAGVFRGAHLRAPGVSRTAARRVTVTWEGALAFETDGELIPATSPTTLVVEPGRLRIVAPPQR